MCISGNVNFKKIDYKYSFGKKLSFTFYPVTHHIECIVVLMSTVVYRLSIGNLMIYGSGKF